MFNATTVSYDTVLKRANLTTSQDILILMFKVKKDELAMNYIVDIFNIKEEDTLPSSCTAFSQAFTVN